MPRRAAVPRAGTTGRTRVRAPAGSCEHASAVDRSSAVVPFVPRGSMFLIIDLPSPSYYYYCRHLVCVLLQASAYINNTRLSNRGHVIQQLIHVAVAGRSIDHTLCCMRCMPDFHSKVLPLVIGVVHFTPRSLHLSIAMVPSPPVNSP